jgi:hypothetical protein
VSIAGILAVVVIMYGGLRWATSAGNEQTISTAKETIISAIVGLLLVLGSYVILNFINPELVNLKYAKVPKIYIEEETEAETEEASITCFWADGKTDFHGTYANTYIAPDSMCQDQVSESWFEPSCYCTFPEDCPVATTGDCTIANLKATCFGENAAFASAICKAESNNIASAPIGASYKSSDYCSDDPNADIAMKLFSFGLFQINIADKDNNIVVSTGGELDCESVYNNGGGQKLLPDGKTYNCAPIVRDNSAAVNYDKCKAAIETPANNIATACKLSSNGKKWGDWSTHEKCGFPE